MSARVRWAIARLTPLATCLGAKDSPLTPKTATLSLPKPFQSTLSRFSGIFSLKPGSIGGLRCRKLLRSRISRTTRFSLTSERVWVNHNINYKQYSAKSGYIKVTEIPEVKSTKKVLKITLFESNFPNCGLGLFTTAPFCLSCSMYFIVGITAISTNPAFIKYGVMYSTTV